MIGHLTQTVRQLRLGELAEASDSLVALIDGLAAALQEPPLADRAQALVPVLKAVLEAQERGDYLFVADLLQYELAPRLAERAPVE